MASYKEGSERLSQTGGGMDGIELSTYQEWVTKNVCKYYFELDSVLRDRPNVRPWFTNEETSQDNDKHVDNNTISIIDNDTLDNDSDESSQPDADNYPSHIMEDNRDDTVSMSSFEIGNDCERTSNSINDADTLTHTRPITLTNSSDTQNRLIGAGRETSSDDHTSSSPSISAKEKKRKQPPKSNRKLTPMEAKGIQRNLLKKKKKSIARRNGSKGDNNIFSMDDDDRELIKETSFAKMNFERKRHEDQQNLESKKLKIESERLDMERATMMLKKEQITAQTSLERSRVVLLKLEIFERREGIKKKHPNVTEEYLNTHFPYPE